MIIRLSPKDVSNPDGTYGKEVKKVQKLYFRSYPAPGPAPIAFDDVLFSTVLGIKTFASKVFAL